MSARTIITTERCPVYGDPWTIASISIAGFSLYGSAVKGRVRSDDKSIGNWLAIGNVNCVLHGFSETPQFSEFEVFRSAAFDILLEVLRCGMQPDLNGDYRTRELIARGRIDRAEWEQWCDFQESRYRQWGCPFTSGPRNKRATYLDAYFWAEPKWMKQEAKAQAKESEMGFPSGGSLLGGIVGAATDSSAEKENQLDYLRLIEKRNPSALNQRDLYRMLIARSEAEQQTIRDAALEAARNAFANTAQNMDFRTITTTGQSPYQNVGIDPAYRGGGYTLSPGIISPLDMLALKQLMGQTPSQTPPAPAPAPAGERPDRSGQPVRKILFVEEE